MRLKKNEEPLSLEEHEKIAYMLLSFLKRLEDCNQELTKGFAEKSLIFRKLKQMGDIGNFLKYSLQQSADMHKKKIDPQTTIEFDQRWHKLYLGER